MGPPKYLTIKVEKNEMLPSNDQIYFILHNLRIKDDEVLINTVMDMRALLIDILNYRYNDEINSILEKHNLIKSLIMVINSTTNSNTKELAIDCLRFYALIVTDHNSKEEVKCLFDLCFSQNGTVATQALNEMCKYSITRDIKYAICDKAYLIIKNSIDYRERKRAYCIINRLSKNKYKHMANNYLFIAFGIALLFIVFASMYAR